MHTSSLLFPTNECLQTPDGQGYPSYGSGRPSPGDFYKPHDDSSLGRASDFRVLIAQDDTGPQPKCVLYDSKSLVSPPTSPVATRAEPASPGITSRYGQTPRSQNDRVVPPISDAQSRPSAAAAARAGATSRHNRGASLSSLPIFPEPRVERSTSPFQRARSGNFATSFASESDLQSVKRSARTHEAEQDMLMECMFGTVSLKGSENSTKFHVLPGDVRDTMVRPLSSSGPSINDSRASSSHKAAPSADQYNRPTTVPAVPKGYPRSTGAPSVLVTRVFNLNAPMALDLNNSSTTSTIDFEKSSEDPKLLKSRKPATFAVAIVVTMPREEFREEILRSPMADSDFSWPGSTCLDALPSLDSSSSSGMKPNWTTVENYGSGSASLPARPDTFHVCTRHVMQHWDVVMRTLERLQRNLEAWITTCRSSSDPKIAEIDLSQMPTGLSSDRQLLLIQRAKATNHGKSFSLQRGGLEDCVFVQTASKLAMTRLAKAFSARNVAVGQNRWHAWRDEARWVTRWASGAEGSCFLSAILAAFLANHLAWMQMVKPTLKQVRRLLGVKKQTTYSSQRSHRTVVISQDKMAARRIVFLLAAFLPRPEGCGTSRRSTPILSHRASPHASRGHLSRMNSLSSGATDGSKGSAALFGQSGDSKFGLAGSKKSSLSRAIQNSRKLSVCPVPSGSSEPASSGLTSPKILGHGQSTVDVSDSVPVVHFSAGNLETLQSSFQVETKTTGVVHLDASANLSSNLQLPLSHSRVASNSPRMQNWNVFPSSPQDPTASSSSRRLSDTQHETLNSVDGGSREIRSSADEDTPSQMVEDLQSPNIVKPSGRDSQGDFEVQGSRPLPIKPSARNQNAAMDPVSGQGQEFAGSGGSPFKLSINDLDGMIDVNIPLTLGNSSCESSGAPFGSPGSLGSFCSTHRSPFQATGNPAELVGGYLSSFHQDLALQAVKPYEGLEMDIREAMCSEPTPHIPVARAKSIVDAGEVWIDGSTTVIPDLGSRRVKRLRVRHLMKLSSPRADVTPPDDRISILTSPDVEVPPTRGSAPQIVARQVKQELVEDEDLQPDKPLFEAMEQLQDQSWPSSRATSRGTSRSNSMRASGTKTEGSATMPILGTAGDACKSLLLEALEQVVRDGASEVKHSMSGSAAQCHEHTTCDVGDRGVTTGRDSPILRSAVEEWLRSCTI